MPRACDGVLHGVRVALLNRHPCFTCNELLRIRYPKRFVSTIRNVFRFAAMPRTLQDALSLSARFRASVFRCIKKRKFVTNPGNIRLTGSKKHIIIRLKQRMPTKAARKQNRRRPESRACFVFETANSHADQDGVVSQAAKPSVRACGWLYPLSGQRPRYRADQPDRVPGWELCPGRRKVSKTSFRHLTMQERSHVPASFSSFSCDAAHHGRKMI